MMRSLTHSDWIFVAVFAFLFVWFVTPTAIAVIRGAEVEPLLLVMLFSVIPLGWPAALIMAFVAPGRERQEPRLELPRIPGYPPDPRFPPGDPRAGYPLP